MAQKSLSLKMRKCATLDHVSGTVSRVGATMMMMVFVAREREGRHFWLIIIIIIIAGGRRSSLLQRFFFSRSSYSQLQVIDLPRAEPIPLGTACLHNGV